MECALIVHLIYTTLYLLVMKRFYSLCFLLVLCIGGSNLYSQNLLKSRSGSHYIFIYQITNDEARTLYLDKKAEIKENHLHTLIDFYPADSLYKKSLPAGHYLHAKTDGNLLQADLHSVDPLQLTILNNSRDLIFLLQNGEGLEIKNLLPILKGNKIRYDEYYQAYRLPKTNKQGTLVVSYLGHDHFFDLERRYNNTALARAKRRVLTTFPINHIVGSIRYVPRNIKSLILYRHVDPPGIYYRIQNLFQDKDYDGFVVLNKPKYKPGDTVKLKAFVHTKKGRLISKKLELSLSSGYPKYIRKKIKVLESYRKGVYATEFVLTDSLGLLLDKDYYLNLFDKGNNNYPSERFRYEQYELKQNFFTVQPSPLNTIAKPPTILIKGVDANDLPLYDIDVEITVLSRTIRNIYKELLFFPDTLWKHKLPLASIGQTSVTLPDSIFQEAAFDYEIKAVFTNTENERQEKSLQLSFDPMAISIKSKIIRDSIHLTAGAGNDSFMLKSFSSVSNELASKDISMPFQEKIDQHIQRYEIWKQQRLIKIITMRDEHDGVDVLPIRSEDSLFISIQNPAQLLIRYQLFKNNRLFEHGTATSFTYKKAANPNDRYYLSVQYLWAGEAKVQNHEMPYAKNAITVDIDHPSAVFPGQTVAMQLRVKDAKGQAVSNADVTAYSITNKFRENLEVPLTDFTKYKERKAFNEFTNEKLNVEKLNTRLNFDRWKKLLHLDSISYYHFLYPDSNFYQYITKAVEAITQLSPYVVKDGAVQTIYYIFFDKELMYYNAATNPEPYAFPIDTGKIMITLRLQDKILKFPAPKVAQGTKLIFSLDLDRLPSSVEVLTKGLVLDRQELAAIRRHYIWVNRSGGQHHAYLQQDNRFHRLTSLNSYNQQSTELVGPFFPGLLTYKSNFELTFLFKSAMTYSFEPMLVDRTNSFDKYSDLLVNTAPRISFNDFVQTKETIENYWQSQEKSEQFNFRRYPDQKENIKLKQQASLIVIENKSFEKKKRLASFLINLDRPDEYYIYPGYYQQFTQLSEDLYQLVMVYTDDDYLKSEPILLKSNGRTCYDLRQQTFLPADDFSRAIIKRIKDWASKNTYVDQVRQKEMQDLRELYYQQNQMQIFDGGRWVTGRITSAEDDSPLPGVNVIVKGTTSGTVTDINGEYGISVPENGVLVFSFIGLVSHESQVGSRSMVNVNMTADVTQLSEVVVVGYGVNAKRSFLTSSVANLQGRTAGVNVRQGGVERDLDIKIRGVSSLISESKPLVVLNGVLVEWNLVKQSDITALEILKGDEAIALYGSRAANGVVLISTKSGMNRAKLLETKLPDIPQFASIDDNASGSSLRKNFRDDAFWQSRLTTDKRGKASFNASFPDDITTWDVHVIALASRKRSAQVTSKLKSFKPLLAQLALPRFLIEGDSSWVVGKINNYGPDTLNIQRAILVNNKIVKQETLQLTSFLGDSIPLHSVASDSMKITYKINHKNYEDGEQRSIPILPKGAMESKGLFLALPIDTSLVLPEFDYTKTLKIYAEADLLDLLHNESKRLKLYPYDCHEQLASKLTALLAEKTWCTYKGKKFNDDEQIEKAIKRLTKQQQKDGGWSWWENGKSQVWISLHILNAFDWAEKLDYKFSYDKEGAKSFLMSKYEYASQAEKLQILVYYGEQGEKVNIPSLLDSIKASHTTSAFHLRLMKERIRQLNGINPDWEWIQSQRKETIKGNWYWGDTEERLFDNDIENTLLAYKLHESKNSDSGDLQRIRNYFAEVRKVNGWRNTYESARIIRTLLPALLTPNNKVSPAILNIAGDTTFTIKEFPFEADLTAIKNLRITKTGTNPIYFTAYQQMWNSNPLRVDGDFVIRTSWPEPNMDLKRGKPVKMIIDLEVQKDASYIMISVPIPAGCSYGNKLQSRLEGEVYREYDINETRIYCENLKIGKYQYQINLEPRFKGKYHLNPAKVEWMYFPTHFGREESKILKVN